MKRESEEGRKKIKETFRKMDRLAKKLGDWEAEGLIREFRDTNLNGALEDQLDVEEVKRRLADPKEIPIPYKKVRKKLGLD